MSEPSQTLPYTPYQSLHRRHTPNPADTDDRSSRRVGTTTPVPERDTQAQDITEAQLRHLYEEEEVKRYISLFSASVTEVRLPQGYPDSEHGELMETDGEEYLEQLAETAPSLPPANPSLSEFIAFNILLPFLPSATRVPSASTLKRMRLTGQRLYLAIFPPYQAFLLDLARLALWKDKQRSLKHCLVFWVLWFFDLLLPAFVFRILISLLQRGLFPYPTLQELQERRQEAAHAFKFGEIIQQRLSVTTLGPIELWRLFKLYKLGAKEKAKDVVNDETHDKHPKQTSTNIPDPSTDIVDTRNEEEDLKRDLLYLLEMVADFHERIKNIYTWRRPHVSRCYAILLSLICFCTLILPVRYIAKFVYWFGGMLFWHVPPVIIALPHEDRARLPLLFSHAPTDVDYAIDLIAKRIAAGQDIGMASHRPSQSGSTFSASTDSLSTLPDATPSEVQPSGYDSINWKKWSGRLAHGKSLVEESRQLFSNRVPSNQMSGEASFSRSRDEQVQVFVAQYASSPGLITLSSTTFSFTPITASRARLVISLDRMRGVKKSGLMKGITLAWIPPESVDGRAREERFHWVGNRDELFARLLGRDGGRWMRVD